MYRPVRERLRKHSRSRLSRIVRHVSTSRLASLMVSSTDSAVPGTSRKTPLTRAKHSRPGGATFMLFLCAQAVRSHPPPDGAEPPEGWLSKLQASRSGSPLRQSRGDELE